LAAVPLTAQQRFPEILRPVFLAGQVVLEDGTPPPDSVIVTMSCDGGRPVPQGYTDSYGRFNFEAGRNVAAMMDVQNANPNPLLGSGNVSTADLTGCDLRAEAAGFASNVIDLSGRRLLESPNVGTLELKKLDGVVGTAFSAMTMHARNDAKKAYERGRALAKEEKFDEAVDELERAVRIEPLFAAAWFELGRVHHDLRRADEAEEAYRKAAAADPEFVKPYRQLALLLSQRQRWQEVLEATNELLRLDPVSYPDGYYFNCLAHFYLNDLDAAEKSARKLITLDGERPIPRARAVLAAILMEKADYEGAAEQLRDYIEIAAPGPEVDHSKAMLEQLEARLPPPAASRPQ
jgi:tetratricopeptide (TPR) repeat protein